MATLKTNYVSGEGLTPGSTGGTSGINATNDRVNTHTHDGTDTVFLSRYDRIPYSAEGSTAITGNGSAQNVFSKTFATTDFALGDLMRITIKVIPDRTAGADTPNLVTQVGSNTVWQETTIGDAQPYFAVIHVVDSSVASRGYSIAEVKTFTDGDVATTSNAVFIRNSTSTLASSTFGTAFTFKMTINPAAATNYTVYHNVVVEKLSTGIA